MRVFWTVMSWSNENKSCIRVDESWCRVDKREFVWEFSTVMSWLNENKSCMTVDKSWQVRVCMRVFSTLKLMTHVLSFSQLTCTDFLWPVKQAKTFINSQNLSQLKVDDSRREWATLILAWPRLTRRIFTVGVFYQIYHISHHLMRNIVIDMI